jgi:hypothetical protein
VRAYSGALEEPCLRHGEGNDTSPLKGCRTATLVAMTTLNRRALLLLPLIWLISLLGCSKVIDSSQVVGTYEARHQNGVEVLELDLNGTYRHLFKASNGSETVYSASWKLEPYGGQPKVFVDNFVQHFPSDSPPVPVGTLLGVEKRWGRTRLYLSYDRDEYYTEKKQPRKHSS